MFDVFGNFDSVEELNACAKGLLEEQDLEHLKVLAEENGIPDGIREVYEQHLSEELYIRSHGMPYLVFLRILRFQAVPGDNTLSLSPPHIFL